MGAVCVCFPRLRSLVSPRAVRESHRATVLTRIVINHSHDYLTPVKCASRRNDGFHCDDVWLPTVVYGLIAERPIDFLTGISYEFELVAEGSMAFLIQGGP